MERQSILEACKGEICKELSKVEVRELRYSQLSCKETFQCGRSVSQLVQDLLELKVSLSAPFLRLTVFETRDEKTNDPEMYRQSSTKKWKRPRDVERQRLQPEHTHAGPALHTELWRHRRTWCAIAQEQKRQASSTFALKEQNLKLEFWIFWSQKRSRSDHILGLLGLSSSLQQSLTYGVKNVCIILSSEKVWFHQLFAIDYKLKRSYGVWGHEKTVSITFLHRLLNPVLNVFFCSSVSDMMFQSIGKNMGFPFWFARQNRYDKSHWAALKAYLEGKGNGSFLSLFKP